MAVFRNVLLVIVSFCLLGFSGIIGELALLIESPKPVLYGQIPQGQVHHQPIQIAINNDGVALLACATVALPKNPTPSATTAFRRAIKLSLFVILFSIKF